MRIGNTGRFIFAFGKEMPKHMFSVWKRHHFVFPQVKKGFEWKGFSSEGEQKKSERKRSFRWKPVALVTILGSGYLATHAYLDDRKRKEQGEFEEALERCQKGEVGGELEELRDFRGRTLLMRAIELGDAALALELIKRKVALHAVDDEGNTALHYAARGSNPTLLIRLFDHLGIDQTNQLGMTPLHVAAEGGDISVLNTLLNNGASTLLECQKRVGPNTYTHLTPFDLAVIRGDESVLKVLLPKCESKQALHLAIEFGKEETLRFLLTQEKTKHLLEEKIAGRTPLMFAAFLGDVRAMIHLNNFDANLQARDANGWTVAHWAAFGRQPEALKLLHYWKCEINEFDVNMRTPRDLVKEAQDGESRSITVLLGNLAKFANVLGGMSQFFAFHLPKNLVVKGGGRKGNAYVGAMEVLEREGMLRELKRVAGTSAGAIFGTLVALNVNAAEMEETLTKTDFSQFLDHPLKMKKIKEVIGRKGIAQALDLYRNPDKILSGAWHTLGVCDGEELRGWIEGEIAQKTQVEYCTFGDLRKMIAAGKPYKHLHINVTRVGKNGGAVVINSEDPQWDSFIISDVVTASASIPGVFKPRQLWCRGAYGTRYPRPDMGSFVDGGVENNFAITAFDKKKFQVSADLGAEGEVPVFNKETLGLGLFTPEENTAPKEVETVRELLSSLVNLYYTAQDRRISEIKPNENRIIWIDNKGVSATNFGTDPEIDKKLIASGKEATESFLKQQAVARKSGGFLAAPLEKGPGWIEVVQTYMHFTGREELLEALKKTFLEKKTP